MTFIDVAGAALLVDTARRLSPDHHLVLHHPPDPLRRIITLLWGRPAGIEIHAKPELGHHRPGSHQ